MTRALFEWRALFEQLPPERQREEIAWLRWQLEHGYAKCKKKPRRKADVLPFRR